MISKILDILFQLSGLYKIYSKRLENEVRHGDIPTMWLSYWMGIEGGPRDI